jgi:hypothetical protein
MTTEAQRRIMLLDAKKRFYYNKKERKLIEIKEIPIMRFDDQELRWRRERITVGGSRITSVELIWMLINGKVQEDDERIELSDGVADNIPENLIVVKKDENCSD